MCMSFPADRTSSCQTFDSLDFARYSDDGDRLESDRVAGMFPVDINYVKQ